MPISFADTLELNCPRCGAPFTAETWLIVDGQERPDLVARILDGTLHDVRCPQCGQTGQAPAPLLYHDGRAQRVLLAVPPDMAEPEWRAVAETLLWTLIGSLPETERDPYLGELQAEAGLAGIASVIQSEGLAGPTNASGDDAQVPLVTAIQALLGAEGPEELGRVFQRYPLLREPQTVTVLRELAFEAFKQGEDEAGSGFSRAADILNDMRDMPLPELFRDPVTREYALPVSEAAEDPLDELVFALLRSHTGEMLAETVDQYPQLLEPELDAQLAAWAARARSAGKSRVADGIDERRAVLSDMRARYAAERPVFDAVQALLESESPADLEAVLVEYDALYTDAADAVLERLATGADPDFTALVEERRGLLRRLRQMLADRSGAGDQA